MATNSTKGKTDAKKKASVAKAKTAVKVTKEKTVGEIKSASAPKAALKINKMNFAQFIEKNRELLLNLLWVVVAVLGLFFVDLFVQYINNDYSAAVVNNRRISVKSLKDKLMERSGQQLLSDMIREEVIKQAAQKAGVEVTKDEIQAEYDRVATLYGGEETLKLALTANGYTKDSYLASLEIQLVAQKTIVPEPSEKDLQAFFTESKEVYFATQETYESDKSNVKRIYIQTQFESKFATWLEAELAKATVKNNLEEEPKYGFFMATRNIFTNLYDSVTKNSEDK